MNDAQVAQLAALEWPCKHFLENSCNYGDACTMGPHGISPQITEVANVGPLQTAQGQLTEVKTARTTSKTAISADGYTKTEEDKSKLVEFDKAVKAHRKLVHEEYKSMHTTALLAISTNLAVSNHTLLGSASNALSAAATPDYSVYLAQARMATNILASAHDFAVKAQEIAEDAHLDAVTARAGCTAYAYLLPAV